MKIQQIENQPVGGFSLCYEENRLDNRTSGLDPGGPIGEFRRRLSFEIRFAVLAPYPAFGDRNSSKVNGDGVFQDEFLDNGRIALTYPLSANIDVFGIIEYGGL